MEMLESVENHRDIIKLTDEMRVSLAKLFVANLNDNLKKYLYSIISLSCLNGNLDDIEYIFKELGGNWENGF